MYVKVGDKDTTFTKRMRHGVITVANQEVGTFEVDDSVFNTSVAIKVTEKDALWSDKGSTESTIVFDTNESKSKEFTFEVKVREAWKFFFRRNTAVFVVNLVADVLSEGVVSVSRIMPKPYGAVFKGKDLNKFDDEIADEVYNWNKEFAAQQLPPEVLLDPSLVKAMIYVESTMGYGIDSNDPDIMQVANPNDPALHTINNDGWSFPSTGEVARENEWINGKVQVLDYHKEAKVVTIRDSIKWGVRWLYHRAQSIEGPGRVWFDWKKAVERYGPLPKPSDKKLYYVDKVWNIYTRGVDPKVIKLWSIAFLLLMLGSTTFYFSMYNRPQGAELNRSQPSEGEVLSDAVYAKEWQMPSYEEARKTEPGNAMPFRMLDNIQTLAAVSYPPTNCKAGPSEYETERRLKNCTYTVGFGDSDMWIAKFKDGGYGFTPSWPPNYGDYYNVGPYGVSIKRIIQGDLNHDGYTDAVVLFEVSYQGNGNPFNVVVLIRQNDASFGQVANYAIEANAEITNLYIENGIIIVHAYIHSDSDPECCPSVYQTFKLKVRE